MESENDFIELNSPNSKASEIGKVSTKLLTLYDEAIRLDKELTEYEEVDTKVQRLLPDIKALVDETDEYIEYCNSMGTEPDPAFIERVNFLYQGKTIRLKSLMEKREKLGSKKEEFEKNEDKAEIIDSIKQLRKTLIRMGVPEAEIIQVPN